MKKLTAIALTATFTIANIFSVSASDQDYEARISALEERVAVLESLLLGDGESESSMTASTGEPIKLGVGTWIVGEDLPEGKYNVTCPETYGAVSFYTSLEKRQESEWGSFENYTICSQSYYDSMLPTMGEAGMWMFTLEANNVLLQNGNCIYIEFAPLIFTAK